MRDIFGAIDTFLESIKNKAIDLTKKAADVLRQFADWLEAETQADMQANTKADIDKAADLESQLNAALATVSTAGNVKGLVAVKSVQLVLKTIAPAASQTLAQRKK